MAQDDQLNLFNGSNPKNSDNSSQKGQNTPLAHKVRPDGLDGFFGQSKALSLLNFKTGRIPHLIFWGPPGCGKTTLAKIFAKENQLELFEFNAVLSGVKELRTLIERAKESQDFFGKKPAIFIDEIHRFNKGQQDALLPYLEEGTFTLFGATTEYPQTSLNRAIISRVKLISLESLGQEDIEGILTRACNESDLKVNDEVVKFLAEFSNGDARVALNQLESLELKYADDLASVTVDQIKEEIINNSRLYDKNSNRHYDVISAFIKSIRGSDPDAAILWLAVMIDGGEDPIFIARRLVISASEDVGNANPNALGVATNALLAVQNIGMPEARIILSQATTYLASSPKSHKAYRAIDKALEYVRSQSTLEVPAHLKNTGPGKKDYLYPHSFPKHYVNQDYRMPKDKNVNFYNPSEQGFEKNFKIYLAELSESNKSK